MFKMGNTPNSIPFLFYNKHKKHNKKDIIIRIAGAVSLVVIAILGTFFVNPDDILLGEIIDMIKSFQ